MKDKKTLEEDGIFNGVKYIHIKKYFYRGYRLNFTKQGILQITTPVSNFGRKKVDAILHKHRRWIKNSYEKISNSTYNTKKIDIYDGANIKVLGEKYIFRLEKRDWEYVEMKLMGAQGSRGDNGNEITTNFYSKLNKREEKNVDDPETTYIVKVIIPSKSRQKVTTFALTQVFYNAFKNKLHTYLENRVQYYSDKTGVEYNQIFVKNVKTRWGSCSSKRNLNFNIKLIFCPMDVVEYLVVHEFCHLMQMNHSKKYWMEVEKLYPEYRKPAGWLKKNGSSYINVRIAL